MMQILQPKRIGTGLDAQTVREVLDGHRDLCDEYGSIVKTEDLVFVPQLKTPEPPPKIVKTKTIDQEVNLALQQVSDKFGVEVSLSTSIITSNTCDILREILITEYRFHRVLWFLLPRKNTRIVAMVSRQRENPKTLFIRFKDESLEPIFDKLAEILSSELNRDMQIKLCMCYSNLY